MKSLGYSVCGCFLYPQHKQLEEHNTDLTMAILQAGSLATFSSRNSLLACRTLVSTGMDRAFFPGINYFCSAPHLLFTQRFLNNPEKTMSGAALFGLALISGSKAVFALAVFSHLAHWWFLSYVEGYASPCSRFHFPPLPCSYLSLP